MLGGGTNNREGVLPLPSRSRFLGSRLWDRAVSIIEWLARDTPKLPIPNSMNRHDYLRTTDSLNSLFRDMIDSLDRPFFLFICRWVALLMSSPRIYGSCQLPKQRKQTLNTKRLSIRAKPRKGMAMEGIE